MENVTRKRLRLPEADYNNRHVFYLTICTQGRQPWFQVRSVLADRFVKILSSLAGKRNSEIFAYCVMPDHVHLLLCDTAPVDFIRLLKGRAARAARDHDIEGLFWQRSFFDRGLRAEDSVIEVAKYIWQNPARAKLVSAPGDYPWSGSLVWPDWREEYGRG